MLNDFKQRQEKFFKKLEKGRLLKCPFCTGPAKFYPRKIYSGQAVALIELSGYEGYVHVKKLESDVARGGDFAKMQLWDLIKQKEKSDTDTHKRTSGYWRITKKGRLFVQNKIKIPARVRLYHNKILAFSKRQVSITDVLKGSGFDYEELMSAR